MLRAECLYWSGSYNLTACGAENHTDNNGNPRATVFWYGNGGTSVSASFNETFAYDGVNRLTGVVDSGGWSRYFAYDQYSNMWLCGWPGIAPNGAAPVANYCSQTPSGIFNTANRIGTGSYDLAGNQLLVAGSNLSYDAENRITSAAQPGIGTVTYTYDGDGQRVMKAVSTGLQTVYVYDIGGKLVAEYSSGAVSVPPCHTCFLSTDHLGSTRLVTDENGNTVSRHDYIPFGEEIAANTGGRDGTFGTFDFVNQKFTAKERDNETGLDYFGARYYSDVQGRFTSPDEPLVDQWETNPQSWNLYAYGRNNPLRFADPSGQKCVDTSNGPADDGTGGGCSAAGVDPNGNIQPQQVNVNAQGGNQLTAFGLNLMFALSNVANDAFRFIAPDSQLLSNTPTNREFTGQLATGVAVVGTALIGPGGEAAQAPREIKVTWKGLLHVIQRHTGGMAGKSFFGDSTAVTGLVKAAEAVAPTPQAGGNFIRIVDAGRTIGTDITTGQATSVYTVVTNKAGELVTAFPGRPTR